MAKHRIEIDLGEIEDSALVTEEDFRREANRLLPHVAKKAGEHAAKVLWKNLQKGLGAPGFKIRSSASEKNRFIRETATDYVRKMSEADRRELLEHIVNSLREQRGIPE